MYKLVLLRHGESLWNKENKFTGWVDVDLSKNGVIEAKNAAKILKEEGFNFNYAYTSYLKRAIKTLNIVLEEMNLLWIDVKKDWRLNEKHYGVLQGLNKLETVKKYGEKQVLLWRRSYDIRPNAYSEDDLTNPSHENKYKKTDMKKIISVECLKDTVERVIPLWENKIKPNIKSKKIIIVAHGNSLRALIKHIDNISDEKIVEMNIPTAIPLVYEFDDNLNPIKNYYLGNLQEIKKKQELVKNQGKN
ncbi:MAG: 2,3-diphosphoglycerate-dependent phosphoglycerate mutase [Nanoarchaeota archaeon]